MNIGLKREGWLSRLFLWCAFGSFITLAVMLTHESDEKVFLGHYSKLIFLLIIALLLISIIGVVLGWILAHNQSIETRLETRLTRWQQKRWFVPSVIIAGCCLISVVWYFFLGNHLPTYGWLRFFISFSILLAAFVFAFGNSDEQTFSKKNMVLIGWVGLLLLVAIAILTISYYPFLLKADEAFDFSMARNALENGHVGPMIYSLSHPPDYFGGIWTWMMAGWLRVTEVSFVSGRFYTLLLSGASLLFIWLTAKRLFDNTTGWLALLIGAYTFISLNHIRYHIHAALWLSVGMFFYSLGKTKRYWWAHFLAGFAVGMGIDSTPVAYCFGLGLGLIYLVEYINVIRAKKQWIWVPFFLMAAGGLFALAIYLKIHPAGTFVGDNTTGSMTSTYLQGIIQGLRYGGYQIMALNYANAFLTAQPILTGFMILGIVTALYDRSENDQVLLIMYFAWMLVIIFAYFYFPFFYIIVAAPICILLAARGLARGIPLLLGYRSLTTSMASAIILVVVCWQLVAVAKDISVLPSSSLEDLVETGKEIGNILPKDARIVAAEPYYFGLLDHPNFVAGAIENYMVNNKKISPQAAWTIINPDAVIFSENWPTEPNRSDALNSYLQDQHFTMLQCYQTHSYGKVELWVKKIPENYTGESSSCIKICTRLGCS